MENNNIYEMIDTLVGRANKAKDEMLKLNQEQIDNIVKEMAKAGLDKHIELAQMAVEETQRGIVEDKITKNMFATEYVYHSIKYAKTVGVIEENEEEGYMLVAEPIGVVAGVTPVTNPTSTTMFKALISIKGRNPIIFSFHPSAQKCSAEAARILRDAAIKAGAPEGCIQWIEEPSLEASAELMKHEGVALILATGGTGMVKSAYSCGKPALGVGPGNVPCYIDKTAKLKTSVNDLVDAFKKFLERKNLEKPITTKITNKEYSVKERKHNIKNALIKDDIIMSILIKEVLTKSELSRWVEFPTTLYKDNEYYVPFLKSDEMATFTAKKNPFSGAMP